MTELPDLDPGGPIVAENVRAMGPVIVAAMFEELKVFQVVDRIVERFQQGVLPIGPGNAGRLLHAYWRDAPGRIGERQRRRLVAAALGIVEAPWLRFVSAVSGGAGQDQLRKAARDLASTLSRHGGGPARAAARRLQAQIGAMTGLLQDPEIRRGYGARDMWQLIDRVATDELGGAGNGARYRTLATQGATIAAWLADNAGRIARPGGALIERARDRELVKACELWLAAAAPDDPAEKGW